jgi:hypothetical protein
MGLAEDTITRLAQRHAAEKELVRDVARRYERAATAAARARESLEVAEAERTAVLAEWAAAPGWNAERVGEYAGVAVKEVAEALRTAATRTRTGGNGVAGHVALATHEVTAPNAGYGRPGATRGGAPEGRGV